VSEVSEAVFQQGLGIFLQVNGLLQA